MDKDVWGALSGVGRNIFQHGGREFRIFHQDDEATFAKTRMDATRICICTNRADWIREVMEVVIDGKLFRLLIAEEVVAMEEKPKVRSWTEEDDSASDGSLEESLSDIGVAEPGEGGEVFKDVIVSYLCKDK